MLTASLSSLHSHLDTLPVQIKTPRLEIEQNGEVINKHLSLVLSIIMGHINCLEERRLLTQHYIRHLKEIDSLAHQPDSSTSDTEDPLWLQRLLSASYPVFGGTLNQELREKYRQKILNMTDTQLINRNLKEVGGGGKRTPTGSFTEDASRYFNALFDKPQEGEILIRVLFWNVIASVKNTMGALKIYQEKQGRTFSSESPRYYSPSMIPHKIKELNTSPSPKPSVETSPTSTKRDILQLNLSASSQIPPQVGRLALENLQPETPLMLSPSASKSYNTFIEGFVKDVGISIARLNEYLSESKKNLSLKIWSLFIEFSSYRVEKCVQESNQAIEVDYQKNVETAFESLRNYLVESTTLNGINQEIEHIRDHFSKILKTIQDSDQELCELNESIEPLQNYLEIFERDLLKKFQLEIHKIQFFNFEEILKFELQNIKENRLELSHLNMLSTHLDNVDQSRTHLEEAIIDISLNANGDRSTLAEFESFMSQWTNFYRNSQALTKQITSNYALEHSLKQIWSSIEELSHATPPPR